MKLTIGWPSTSPNMPSWKTATVDAERGEHRQQEARGWRSSGTRIERKTTISSTNASPTTTAR